MKRIVAALVLLSLASCRPRGADTPEASATARNPDTDANAPIINDVRPDSAVQIGRAHV